MILKKQIVILVVAIVSIFLIIKFIPDEKKRLANDIRILKKAVENEDRNGVLKYLDTQYKDRNNLTCEELKEIIKNFFKEVDSIKVTIADLKIKIDSVNTAKTVFASCSLGLRVFAKYERERVLVFGSIKPASVRAWFKKGEANYKLYYAEY